MEKFQSVLLHVWREACRHIEIGESAASIAALLRSDLPLEKLLVQKLDFDRQCIETIAVSVSGGWTTNQVCLADCSKKEMSTVHAWFRTGEVIHCRAHARGGGPLQVLAPGDGDRDSIAGPLSGSANCCGALVLIAGPEQSFSSRHQALLQALLGPFSVALENDRQIRELAALREAAEADKRSLLARLGRVEFGDTIIGAQSGLTEVMERVRLVAHSDAPVLIFGETGSGKELIARSIHQHSSRSAGAFIRVNCGAIPPELIDSQLFGHEKGAFTGAVTAHKGWFERADGGTLLLDEIAELPPAAQVRFLRILQDGWLERVGGHDSIRTDVRIVAATHRDLAAMVAEGAFREDLWYRIAVFPIVLPPLRHRRDDIPDLARHFARRAALRFGLVEQLPTSDDIALMASYDWPGNVREVAAVMDRAAILGNGQRLEVAKALGGTEKLCSFISPGGDAMPRDSLEPGAMLPLEEATRRHIEMALKKTKGRVEGFAGAARLLEINPNTLRAKMRKLKIDRRKFH